MLNQILFTKIRNFYNETKKFFILYKHKNSFHSFTVDKYLSYTFSFLSIFVKYF